MPKPRQLTLREIASAENPAATFFEALLKREKDPARIVYLKRVRNRCARSFSIEEKVGTFKTGDRVFHMSTAYQYAKAEDFLPALVLGFSRCKEFVYLVSDARGLSRPFLSTIQLGKGTSVLSADKFLSRVRHAVKARERKITRDILRNPSMLDFLRLTDEQFAEFVSNHSTRSLEEAQEEQKSRDTWATSIREVEDALNQSKQKLKGNKSRKQPKQPAPE